MYIGAVIKLTCKERQSMRVASDLVTYSFIVCTLALGSYSSIY